MSRSGAAGGKGAVLEVRGLNVEFATARGPLKALRDVDLDIPAASVVGVVGESGSGKSTLAGAVMRLLAENTRIASGEVRFEGQDLLKASAAAMRAIRGERISMVFQDPMTSLNPVLTIGTQMVDIQYRRARSREEKTARAVEMLRRVGIPDAERRMGHYPHQFSGGMRQRIAIAMALETEPALLIADEPTTALDATLEVQIIHRLKELQRSEGCAILFISHHLGVIAELCDYVIVMYGGEVVERGTVRDIFHRPGHPYTVKLLECDPARIAGRSRSLPTIPGDVPDLVALSKGCIFAPRCPRAVEVCGSLAPPEVRLAAGHRARCHLAVETGDGTGVGNGAGAGAGSGRWGRVRRCGGVSAILEVEDVQVRYRVKPGFRALLQGGSDAFIDAVAGVSLTIGEAETFGLVGESGSGKTTLARSIMGLLRPREGSIRFRGRDVVGIGPRARKAFRREVGAMFQDPVGSLSPRLTVRSLLSEPFRIHGLRGRDLLSEVRRLLRMVGLSEDFASRYPHQLSGGQARRIGVARALALGPKLVIADEPTAGLDVSVQGEVLNLLGRLQQELGISILAISHNLNVVRHITDRMGIMYLGRLVEQGPTDAIFSEPRHPYTLALLSANPQPDPDAVADRLELQGEIPSLMERPGGCEFHPRCPFARARCRESLPGLENEGGVHAWRCFYPVGG